MRRIVQVSRGVALMGVLVMLLSLGAMAELGGTVATVQADQARVNGTRNVSQRAAYVVHEIKTGNQGTIREYVSPQGKVFAVSYEGRFVGESNGLLGSYATALVQARSERNAPKRIGGSVHVEAPGVVYRAAGHMGYFHMTAYTSEQLPAGVTPEEIQ